MKSDVMKKKTSEQRDMLLILLAAALLIARAFFGFDSTDEPYYLATAFDRAAKGFDMSGAYSIHQTSAFLTAPLVLIYRFLFGSMQGSLLLFRIAYTAAMAITAMAVYRTIRKKAFNSGAALTVALLFEVFCPLAIPTFSYNTLLLVFVALSLCAFFSIKRTGRVFVLTGVWFSFAVFAYPPVILCLPIYAFMVKLNEKRLMQTSAGWQIFTGMAVSGCMLVLSYVGTPWDAVIDILRHMFRDPEHQKISLMMKMRTYISGFLKTYGLPAMLLNCLLLLCACFVHCVHDEAKKRILIAHLCRGLLAAFALALLHLMRLPRGGTIKINLLMHLFTFVLPILRMASGQKQRGLMLLWMLGLVVSVAVHVGTNNGFIVSAYPLIFSSAASLLYADRVLQPYGKGLKAFAALTAACYVLLTGYYRVTSVYRDAPLPQLNTKIETGVAKGLYTTKERAQAYETLQKSLSGIKPQLRGKKLLVIPLEPWLYPETETLIAGPNAWRVTADDTRLEGYYERYPQLLPDWVLIRPGEEAALKDGSALKELLKGYDYSNDPNYGTLYRRNATAVEGS